MEKGPTPEQQDSRAIGVATGLGCSVVVALIVCIGGGVWLDNRFGTMPVLTLLGVVLGLAAAGYQLWELARIGSKTQRLGPLGQQFARLPVPGGARKPSDQTASVESDTRER
jgi:F0F1-type ATP synthase assembly protein I